jgi:phosphoribosylglycinamide formyltransferase-1
MANASSGRTRKPEAEPLSVVVLASGTGTNLQAILNTFGEGSDVEIVGVASNNPDAQALRRAQDAGVPTEVFPRSEYSSREERDEALALWIDKRGAELIVLAGYLEILSSGFVNRFRARIINVHPSLLPKFPGLRSIEMAFDAGARKSGVTIHIVDEGVDTGPKIAQRTVRLHRHEGLEEFERRIHEVEHELLPNVIARLASGELDLDAIQESAEMGTLRASHGKSPVPLR